MDKILLHDAAQIFEKEPKLIELPSYGRGVFVGDTHGDLNATETVLGRYLHNKKNTLVFLGDYVDRGDYSRENVDLLLRSKVENPKRMYLLMGNHEGRKYQIFYPADFWESLSPGEADDYERLFTMLPLAASGKGLIALHGAPPDVGCLEDINHIKPKSREWYQLTWGDLIERKGEEFSSDRGDMLRNFGTGYFSRVMTNLGKNVLIRSHQPRAPELMFNNKCLTLFTSHAYKPKRTVAVADLGKETASVDDLEIREV
jgi:predicted phosphodiesterase